ncbi:hypothetical protein [Capnocytophaga cynodegmi]|uniref:hypothetical protein n=1 Tax=Capnocytophaga cynodegmi TaxID=28189 RepID=UPI00385B3E1A
MGGKTKYGKERYLGAKTKFGDFLNEPSATESKLAEDYLRSNIRIGTPTEIKKPKTWKL